MSFPRCTECNKIVRPVVAIDIDGTLGDFHHHFLRFAVGYMDGKPALDPPTSHYDGSRPMRQWFCDYYGTTEDVWRDIKLAYRQGGMKRTMPSYGYGRMLTQACHRVGAEVWITTTRPYLRLDNIDPDTRFWLDKNEVEYDGLIYDEHKYSHLLARVGAGRVVAVLEDLPEEFNEAARLFGRHVPILYRANHNRYFWPALDKVETLTQMVHDGESAWRKIHTRILMWKGIAESGIGSGTGSQVGEHTHER